MTVPAAHFVHFVPGLLDGDGTVYVLRHRPTPNIYPNSWYVRLWTGRKDFYRLKYGKIESRVLLAALYADPAWPALERKRVKWLKYEASAYPLKNVC